MIGITLGDPGGIGAEIVLKSIESSGMDYILFGNRDSLLFYSRNLNIKIPRSIEIVDIEGPYSIGEICAENGEIAYKSIISGVDCAMKGDCDSIVTAPINKKAIFLAGHEYPGHTEILAEKCSVRDYAMMMVGEKMHVVFITTHVPLYRISSLLSEDLIVRKVELAVDALKNIWGIKEPSVGILGLNPHAGDSGLFGNEEDRIIKPAIETLKEHELNVYGPFPSDTYWATEEHDCTVAMYHDQGMIPFKLLNYRRGVNTTIGLPFPRTSPDHGTAFGIVGKGVADPGSMKKAIELASFMSDG